MAMLRAVAFFRGEVSEEGGYVWRYSADLAKREGEGRVDGRAVWVQPPGTPAVGLAMLAAHALTGEETCLAGAVDAARVLIRGQLHSGGWTYRIDLDPAERRRTAYRVDGPANPSARKQSSLDDNTTQSALLLLMRVDRALDFRDEAIHDAAEYALQALLRSQFACGGWPQAFDDSLDPAACIAEAASFPEDWPREYPGHRQYWYRPTLNDGLMEDLLPVLLEAAAVYGDDACHRAALRGGEFLLRAQLPEPQPGWAQQYNESLQPIWARKFEPPAITGSESRGVIRMLLRLYRETGDETWLRPIPRALAYYRRCELPDGTLARFYEMATNRPLYFTRDYRLTYDPADVPDHYAFTVPSWAEEMERAYHRARDAEPAVLRAGLRAPPVTCTPAQARSLIDTLDSRGAWVETKRLRYFGDDDTTTRVIDCATFAENVVRLAAYAGAH
jgi:hypothetical protein